ncbi:MAG: hypothetical protein R3B47_04635 [Bacteroidia bacterium]
MIRTTMGLPLTSTILSSLDEDNHDIEDIIVNPPCVTNCEMDEFFNNQHSFLFTSGNFPGLDATYSFVNGSGNIQRYSNGSANVTGVLQKQPDPNLRWEVNVWLIHEKDWGEWSANGGSYKIGAGVPRMLFQT